MTSNSSLTRRRALIVGAGGLFALGATRAVAQAQPKLIYGDGLAPGWWIGGWSEQQAGFAVGDQKAVKVNMKAWNALTFQTGTPIALAGYSTLTVLLHGGDQGKQELKISLRLGEKAITKELTLRASKGEWARIDCQISKFKPSGDTFDNIFIQNKSAETVPEFYLNYVILQ